MARAKKKAKKSFGRVGKTVQAVQDVRSHGQEPKWDTPTVVEGAELIRALGWYVYCQDHATLTSYFLDSVKQQGLTTLYKKLRSIPAIHIPRTFGAICKIRDNGGLIPTKTMAVVKNELIKIVARPSVTKAKPKKSTGPTTTIQQRMMEKARDIIGDIEQVIDEEQYDFDMYQFMVVNEYGGSYGKIIADYFDPIYRDHHIALHSKDKELVDSYRLIDLKKMVSLLESIVRDGNRFANNAKRARPKRRKKVTPSNKLVDKLQLAKENTELKIVSVDPSKLIGSKEAWFFNTKNSTLMYLVAQTSTEMTVKGTTIQWFDPDKSWVVRCGRDPVSAIQIVLSGTKPQRRNITKTLKVKPSSASGRINNNMILLKVA